MPHRFQLPLAAALIATLALAGCKKDAEPAAVPDATMAPAPAPIETTPAPEPAPAASALTVTSIETGKAVGADNRVATPTATFGAKDTLYVSLNTEGAATNVPVTVTWTFQDGQQAATETKTVTTAGPATHEFHAEKPSGWPTGKYKVDVLLNGAVVQTREIEVK